MKAAVLIGAVVGALALAGAAAAASGNGATVANSSSCWSSPFATWCTNVKMVTQSVTTPSGNESYVSTGTMGSTVSLPWMSCTHANTDEFHVHWLLQDGDVQSQEQHFASTQSFTCDTGADVICVSTVAFHLANGEVQIVRTDGECTVE
jgi:hypothetical protein